MGIFKWHLVHSLRTFIVVQVVLKFSKVLHDYKTGFAY
jgi:hypothetical protein